jgi:hypothetical protein
MPNLDQEIAAEAARESAAETKAKQSIKDQERAEAYSTFGRLDDLLKNPDYLWFMDKYIAPMVKTEHDAALNVKLPKAKQNDHAERHDIAAEILGKLADRHRHLKNQIEGWMATQTRGV